MPEWTVQRIIFIDSTESKRSKGRTGILCDKQLWEDFELKYHAVIAKINSILDKNGKIIANIGKDFRLEAQDVDLPIIKAELKLSSEHRNYKLLLFSKEFVKEYGLREGEYVDLLIHGMSKHSNTVDVSEKIYPKRFIRGKMDIQPSGMPAQTEAEIVEPFLEKFLSGEFYNDLIEEINRTHAYQLSRSSSILIRTLFENLVIDLLRTKYGMNNVEMFYNTERKQFHGFSKTLDIFRKNVTDFAPITSAFDQTFFEFLDSLREDGNSSAHTVDNFIEIEKLNESKKKINHYLKAINNTLEILKKS